MYRVLANTHTFAAPGPLYLPAAPMIGRAVTALAPVRKFLRREPSLLFTAVAALSVVVIMGTIIVVVS